MKRVRTDIGETLIEIVFTIVIIGLTVTALLSSLATAGNAGNAQRTSVQGDYVLRNYASATKAATQSCVAGAGYSLSYTPNALYPVSGAGSVCPPTSAPQSLTLTVTGPRGYTDSVVVMVRTP